MMFLQTAMAFIATVSFSCLFNIPRSELIYIGLTGAMGWLCYQIFMSFFPSGIAAEFVSTVLVALSSRILARWRKMPLTVFLLGGIICLVPGAGMYNTMYALISQGQSAFETAVETAKILGAICIGIILTLSLPPEWFSYGQKPKSLSSSQKEKEKELVYDSVEN
ncbi:MAG: threonine/serine exporter family protein [Clostridiales bacterium]|jgi:uncharacterized membrane protein YjjB (DUF3815 family)|nr:threonine/serine exporter family protein [Clostridiales bacterium]